MTWESACIAGLAVLGAVLPSLSVLRSRTRSLAALHEMEEAQSPDRPPDGRTLHEMTIDLQKSFITAARDDVKDNGRDVALVGIGIACGVAAAVWSVFIA